MSSRSARPASSAPPGGGAPRTHSRVVIILDDLADIGPVEDAIVRLTAAGEHDVHIISTDAGESLVAAETAPARVRLLLLMARLADRLIPVTGDLGTSADLQALRRAISLADPERVYVAAAAGRLQRMLRRDLRSRLRRLVAVDVAPLPRTRRVALT